LTPGGSSAEGSATSLARSDHTHALPAFGTTAGTFAQGNDARFGTTGRASFDFGVGGLTSVRVSVVDASVTAATRVRGGAVVVPSTRSLDEFEMSGGLTWAAQVTPGVGIEFIMVSDDTATGIFFLDYSYQT
jgi:hypothetical protein